MKRSSMVLALSVILALGQGVSLAEEGSHQLGYKDPKTAAEWGYLLPGLGHMYAGVGGKGFLLMGTSAGALAGGWIITLTSGDANAEVGDNYDFSVGEKNWTPSYIGSGIYLLGWLYSVVDAPKAAQRTNLKRGFSGRPVHVAPYVTARGTQAEYGVRLLMDL